MRTGSALSKLVKKVKSFCPFLICPTCPQPCPPQMPRGLRPSPPDSDNLSFPSSLSPVTTAVILESDLTNYFIPLKDSSMQRGQTDKTLALRSEFLMPPVWEFQCQKLKEILMVKGRYF